MSESTKSDKSQKKPLTRFEYHGVITSYAGLILSLIAIVLSVITMYQSHVMETREIVQILRAEDDGYYHFDGETLFKNFQVTVANNSAIPVSVVEMTIERDGEARTFKVSDLSNVLPLNMEANHTEMITIPWNIELSAENIQEINKALKQDSSQESEREPFKPDTVYPSRGTTLETDDISDISPQNEDTLSNNTWAGSCQHLKVLEFLWKVYDEELVMDNSSSLSMQSVQFEEIPLSVTCFTAKNHQFSLKDKDQKPELQWENEGSWVTRHVTRGVLTLNNLIEAMKATQNRDSDSTETPDSD